MDSLDRMSNSSDDFCHSESNLSTVSGLSGFEEELNSIRQLITSTQNSPQNLPQALAAHSNTTIMYESRIKNLTLELQNSLKLNEKYKNELYNLECGSKLVDHVKFEKLLEHNSNLQRELDSALAYSKTTSSLNQLSNYHLSSNHSSSNHSSNDHSSNDQSSNDQSSNDLSSNDHSSNYHSSNDHSSITHLSSNPLSNNQLSNTNENQVTQKINAIQKINSELHSQILFWKNESLKYKNETETLGTSHRKLKLELEDLKSDICAKTSTITELKNKITEQHIESQNLIQSNMKLSNNISVITNDLRFTRESEEWYKSKLHDAQTEKSKLINELSSLKGLCVSKDGEMGKMRAEMSRLKVKCEDLSLSRLKEKEMLMKKVGVIESDMRKLLEKDAQRLNDAQKPMENISHINNSLLNDSPLNNSHLNDSTLNHSQKLIEKDTQELMEKDENLMEDLQKELTNAKRMQEENQAYFEHINKQYSELLSKFMVLQNTLNEKDVVIDSIENLRQTSSMKISILSDEVKQYKDELEEVRAEKNRLELALNYTKYEKTETDSMVSNIRDDFNKFLNAYTKLKNDLHDKEKTIMNLQKDKQDLFMSHNWQVCEMEQVKHGYQENKQKYKSTLLENGKLKEELGKLKENLVKLQEDVGKSRGGFEVAQKNFQGELEKLQDANADLTEKNKMLEQSNRELGKSVLLLGSNSNCSNCHGSNNHGSNSHGSNSHVSNSRASNSNVNSKSNNLTDSDPLDQEYAFALQQMQTKLLSELNIQNVINEIYEEDLNLNLLHMQNKETIQENTKFKYNSSVDKLGIQFLYYIYLKACKVNGLPKLTNDSKTSNIDSTEINSLISRIGETLLHIYSSNCKDQQEQYKKEQQIAQITTTNKSKTNRNNINIKIRSLEQRFESTKNKNEELNAFVLEINHALKTNIYKYQQVNNNLLKEIKQLERLIKVGQLDQEEKQKRFERINRTMLRKVKEQMRARNAADRNCNCIQNMYESLSSDHNSLKLQVNEKDASIKLMQETVENYKKLVDRLNKKLLPVKSEDDSRKTNVSLERKNHHETLVNDKLSLEARIENLSVLLKSSQEKESFLTEELKQKQQTLNARLEELQLTKEQYEKLARSKEEMYSQQERLAANFKAEISDLLHRLSVTRSEKAFLDRLCSDLKQALQAAMNQNEFNREQIKSLVKQEKEYASLPDIPMNVPSPHKLDDEYISHLLQLCNRPSKIKPLSDLQCNLNSLKQEISSLHQQIFDKVYVDSCT